VDLGATSANVLRQAAALAARDGAELILVHMLPPPTMLGFPFYDVEHWTNQANTMLEKLRAEAGVSATLTVRVGELAAGLNALAEEFGADLLVIGRHPDAGMAGRLLEQAYTVICESQVPVLSV
jgi:nucleotide-binding universal stress UspA family protein